VTWDLSCPDWADRLRAGRSLVPDLPLNQAEGDRAVAVFNRLKLADVPGTPRLGPRLPNDPPEQKGDAAGEWFRDVVRALFGSLDPVTRERMIRELFLLVPKKNSKTSYGALLMLTALLLNQRPKAPFIMTAPVQDVADLAFAQAAGAIALDDVLSAKLHVREHLKTIIHRETRAELQIMTFDPAVLTGQKVAGALIDELHVVAKMSKAANAIRQLRGGMLPFPEAFLAFITTQSEEAPSGVFKAELQKARAIRDGEQEGAMLPVLYEFPREMQQSKNKQWKDPANWPMVTPNAGRSISIARLVQEMATAEATSEEELRAWASQHLNVEIGLALQSDRWAGADFWESAEIVLTLDELLRRCEVAVVGGDGGGLDDLLGQAVVGRERETGKWLAWFHAWAHKIALERRKEIAPRLLDFQREGNLTIVERPGQDVQEFADNVCKVRDAGLLPEKQAIGVDAAGITDIVDELVSPDRGIQIEQIIAVSQGWRLNGAIKTTERKLAGGELLVAASGLMPWCVGNARIEDKGNAISITKQASGKAKIDPLMALFDAVSLMALNPAPAASADQPNPFTEARPCAGFCISWSHP
jgi:phage terminase large subunit-like protein